MTREQKRYFKRQNDSMLEYYSNPKNRRERENDVPAHRTRAQARKNKRDNTLFLAAIFGGFAVLITLAMMFPV